MSDVLVASDLPEYEVIMRAFRRVADCERLFVESDGDAVHHMLRIVRGAAGQLREATYKAQKGMEERGVRG